MISKMTSLKKFTSDIQAYGTYWAGFNWTLFGCLTFKTKVTPQHGEALLKNYMRRLGQELKTHIAYIAVPEYRYAGQGMSPIPFHFHLLAACPPSMEDEFMEMATALWPTIGGECEINPYDASRSGTFYIAKLAGQINFEWIEGNLEKLSYEGSMDLYSALQSSPYVPEHAKGPLRVNTLTVYTGKLSTAGAPHSFDAQSSTKNAASGPQKVGPASALPSSQIPMGLNVHDLGHVWSKHVMQTTGIKLGKLSPKEYGQIKQLRSKLGAALAAVIEYVIHNWKSFGDQVVSKGYPAAPNLPNIGFLCKNHAIALKLAHQAASHKTPKSACEWKLLDLYPLLEQTLHLD